MHCTLQGPRSVEEGGMSEQRHRKPALQSGAPRSRQNVVQTDVTRRGKGTDPEGLTCPNLLVSSENGQSAGGHERIETCHAAHAAPGEHAEPIGAVVAARPCRLAGKARGSCPFLEKTLFPPARGLSLLLCVRLQPRVELSHWCDTRGRGQSERRHG